MTIVPEKSIYMYIYHSLYHAKPFLSLADTVLSVMTGAVCKDSFDLATYICSDSRFTCVIAAPTLTSTPSLYVFNPMYGQ